MRVNDTTNDYSELREIIHAPSSPRYRAIASRGKQ